MAALAGGLDNPADNLTTLRAVVTGMHDVIEANMTGQ